MHPVIKSTVYTFAAFFMLVAFAWLNRGKIDQQYQLASKYHQEVKK